MRLATWSTFGIAALAAVARAQTMPQCASDCLTTNLKNSSCNPTDSECICADQTLMNNVQTCVLGSCTIIESLAAKNATSTLCKEPIQDKSLVAPIATAITGTLAIALVLVRVYDCVSRKDYHWADLCAIVSMVFSLPMDVFEFFMMGAGMGKDIWTLTPTQITNVVKYTWVTQVFYIPAIILSKVAIVCFFMRVFPSRKFRLLCQGTIVYCFLFMISTTVAAILACVPVQDAWSNWSGMDQGKCYNNNAFWWAHSALNIAADLWILALPVPMLSGLQLKLKKKIYLVLMFSVGIVITVISIIRFSGLITYSTSSNPTYNNVMVATYSVIECNVSIMCCCMPATVSFLRRVFPGIFQSTNRSLDYKKSPFPTNAIQKSVTHTISYMPRAGDSDVIELMDREGNERRDAW